MKPGVMIVNCARGGIIHEGDLREALKSQARRRRCLRRIRGRTGQAGQSALSLWIISSVRRTSARQTTEAQENVAVGIAEQIVDYFTKGIARAPSIFPRSLRNCCRSLQPYLTLAEQLGKLQAQLLRRRARTGDGRIQRGSHQPLLLRRLTIAVLKGLLTPYHGRCRQLCECAHRGQGTGHRSQRGQKHGCRGLHEPDPCSGGGRQDDPIRSPGRCTIRRILASSKSTSSRWKWCRKAICC